VPTGYFGPLSARVRGLFVKHTRTGNPLVDSVAEHQPANEQAYQHYLHHIYHVAPVGFALSLLRWTDANLFLVLYAVVAYFFSNKMARLIILLGPVASALAGVAIGTLADQLVVNVLGLGARTALGAPPAPPAAEEELEEEESAPSAELSAADREKNRAKRKVREAAKAKKKKGAETAAEAVGHLRALGALALESFDLVYNNPFSLLIRLALAACLVYFGVPRGREFYDYSHQLAEGLSQPQIMFKAKLYDGSEVMVDDYREAYWRVVIYKYNRCRVE
jgi:dolichyl-diphosphooligosaccharide--protein glycosyltransferase